MMLAEKIEAWVCSWTLEIKYEEGGNFESELSINLRRQILDSNSRTILAKNAESKIYNTF